MIVLSKFIVLVVFLVICYLIAAPLFLNRYHRLDLLQVIVSCALGSLIAALVFVLVLVSGITNHIVVLSVLFGVAIYNVNRLGLRIDSSSLNPGTSASTCFHSSLSNSTSNRTRSPRFLL